MNHTFLGLPLRLLAVVVVVIIMLTTRSSPFVAAIRDYTVTTADGYLFNEFIAGMVYDPDGDMMVFASLGTTTNTTILLAWPLSGSPNQCIHIAGTVAGYSGITTQTAGALSQVQDTFGITLALHPSDGTYFGWLVAASTTTLCKVDFINKTAPYATTANVAGGGGCGYANGLGAAAQFQGLAHLCMHRGAMKHWVLDSGNNRIREASWNLGAGQLAVTTLAGSGTQGHVDGAASSAQFKGFWGCAVAPPSGAAPIALFVTEDSVQRVRRITPVTTAGTVSTILYYATGDTTSMNLNLDVHLRSDGTMSLAYSNTANFIHIFEITEAMLSAPASFYVESERWNPINITSTASILGAFFLPNGTLIETWQGSAPAFSSFSTSPVDGYWAGTRTRTHNRSRSESESHTVTNSHTKTMSASDSKTRTHTKSDSESRRTVTATDSETSTHTESRSESRRTVTTTDSETSTYTESRSDTRSVTSSETPSPTRTRTQPNTKSLADTNSASLVLSATMSPKDSDTVSLRHTETRSDSLSECIPNPIVVDQQLTFPPSTIAPITDSIFDFNSFTPQCCGKITESPFSATCRNQLGNCTFTSPGVSLFSAKYLLHGTFSSTGAARGWALKCLPQYATCMRNGVAANSPLALNPLCKWPSEAAARLNDPSELAIFATAAIVGMNSPEILDVVAQIAFLGGAGGTVGTEDRVAAPTPAPPGGPSSVGKPSTPSDIVAAIPSCPASHSAYKCLRSYGGVGSSCSCPATTLSQTMHIKTHWSSLATTNPHFAALPSAVKSCVRDSVSLTFCTEMERPDAWITAFSNDVASFVLNGTLYKVGGSCVEPNPKTGKCACPFNTSAHEFAMPVVDASFGVSKMRIVTFCMRRGTTVFFEGLTAWDSLAPSCFHPFGSNYSCQCVGSVAKRRVPASIYKLRADTATVPGELVFCDSDEQFPDEVDPAVIATTIGITIATGIAGGNLDALQAAAVAMSICTNSSAGNSRKALVFADIDVAGKASGLVFMFVFALAIVIFHWFVAVLICCFYLARGKSVPANWDTGLYPLLADVNDSDNKNKNKNKNKYEQDAGAVENDEEGGVGGGGARESEMNCGKLPRLALGVSVDTEGQTQSVWDVWEFSAIKIRFPHYSILILRVLFAGFASESASLFRYGSGNPTYYALGAIGLGVCVFFIALTLFFSWRGVSQYEGANLLLRDVPEEFDLTKPEFAPPQPEDVQELSLVLKSSLASGHTSPARSTTNMGGRSSVGLGSRGGGSRAAAGGGAAPSSPITSFEDHIREMDVKAPAVVNATNKDGVNEQEENEVAAAAAVAGPKQIRVKSIEETEQGSQAPQHTDDEASAENNNNNNNNNNSNNNTNNSNHAVNNSAFLMSTTTTPATVSLDPALEAGLYGERVVIGGEVVRIAPYFVWYTHDFGFASMPRSLHWWFLPRGWWVNRRGYTRRYAAFYYTYIPRCVSWAPALTTFFLLLISLVGTTNSCEIPLIVSGVVNLLMALLFTFTMPMRRPFENVLVILQYALNFGLGVARGLGKTEESLMLFYTVAGISALNLLYILTVVLLEIFFMWEVEISRFHCPKMINPETNGINLDQEKSSD